MFSPFAGLDEEDFRRTWTDDAETLQSKAPPSVETARAIYNYALGECLICFGGILSLFRRNLAI